MEYSFWIEILNEEELGWKNTGKTNPGYVDDMATKVGLRVRVKIERKDKIGPSFLRDCQVECPENIPIINWGLEPVGKDMETYKKIFFEILRREVKAEIERVGPKDFVPDPPKLKKYTVNTCRHPSGNGAPPYNSQSIVMSPGPHEANY